MFSGYYFWVSPSLSLQDIFQTPLDLLGAEQIGFLAVRQEVRQTCRPFDIPGSKIVKILAPLKTEFPVVTFGRQVLSEELPFEIIRDGKAT